jgi:hypothetical protein
MKKMKLVSISMRRFLKFTDRHLLSSGHYERYWKPRYIWHHWKCAWCDACMMTFSGKTRTVLISSSLIRPTQLIKRNWYFTCSTEFLIYSVVIKVHPAMIDYFITFIYADIGWNWCINFHIPQLPGTQRITWKNFGNIYASLVILGCW